MASEKPTGILARAATDFAAAKAGQIVTNLGDKAAGNTSRNDSGPNDDSGQDDGEEKKGFIGNTMENLAEGGSTVGSAVKGLGSSIKEGVTGLFTRKGGGGGKRPHNIVEDVWLGVPPDVAFAAFTQWEEFPSFMKGPTSVTRGDEKPEEELEEGEHPLEGEETNWKGKIFLSTREQKATTIDYDPPNRISWKAEGPKGTIDGTITFTPLGDNATLMLVVLEYRSKGPVEWIANRWRAVGRRMRLDLKHFRRYVMRTEPDELPEPEEADEAEEPTDETPEGQPEEPTPGDEEVPEEVPEEGAEGSEDETDETTPEEGVEEPVEDPDTSTEPEEEPVPDPEPSNAARSKPARRARV